MAFVVHFDGQNHFLYELHSKIQAVVLYPYHPMKMIDVFKNLLNAYDGHVFMQYAS